MWRVIQWISGKHESQIEAQYEKMTLTSFDCKPFAMSQLRVMHEEHLRKNEACSGVSYQW